MGTWPQFSYPYPEILKKLNSRGGNNSPMPYANGDGGVSGMLPWLRVISALGASGPQTTGGGLVMQSNYPEDSFNTRYGNGSNQSGIIGFELDMVTPVRPPAGRPMRPSPLISGLSVSEVDVGRKTTNFSITCYTQEQMEEVSKYFLEPGFYVFVEWGWNTLKSRSQWVGDAKNNGAITPCQIAKHINYKYVQDKRKASEFEYDCALGLITKGSISFGDNETYIINVELISQGSVAKYMQSHKAGASTSTTNQSSIRYDPAAIDESAKSDGVAKTLFKQVFNLLPSQKQVPAIKAWIDQPLSALKQPLVFTEYNQICPDNTWADESNYINMDSVVVKSILENLKRDTTIKSSTGNTLKIPTDKPFLSQDRFIRFELAYEIMNYAFINLAEDRKSSKSFGCDDNKVSHRINIDTAIIGAFPHMWSLDKSVLYIPNPTAPDFNIDSAFSGEKPTEQFIDYANLGNKVQNLHPTTNITSFTGTRKKNNDGYQGAPHAFPSQYNLTKEDNNWIETDATVSSLTMAKQNWGWLKNLYINFDLFCSVLQTPNYTIQDALYDLLNSMSAACNSHWKFQIVERYHPNTGCTELHVVDLNFNGKINLEDEKVPIYQMRGTTSPFIEIDFNTTTSAIHQNNILFKRYSDDRNGTKRDSTPDLGGVSPVLGSVFSDEIEYVGTIINYVEIDGAVESDETETPKSKTSDADKESATKATNYEFFIGKAGVFPRIQNRDNAEEIIKSLANQNIQNIFMVGTYNDSLALRKTFLIDKELYKEVYGTTTDEKGKVNAPFGMATVDFKIHGMSGWKRGDTLRFEGLPSNFGAPHVYEVTSMEHEITTTGWYTRIKTGMRAYGANSAAK